MNPSIRFKLGFFIIFSILTALTSIALFYWFFKRTAFDTHFVNVAGSQRMLSERLLHYAKMVQSFGRDEDRLPLLNTIDVFEKKLHVLEMGGLTMGSDLPPIRDDFRDEIKTAKQLWKQIKPSLINIAHQETPLSENNRDFRLVEKRLPELRNAMNAAVSAYEASNRELRRATFNTIIMLALAGGASLFFSLWIFIAYIRDRHATEKELRKAYKEIQQANRLKSEFLSNISHEIRTPMNGIIGMTEFLLETDLSEEQREYLDIVKKSADSLLTLLNDLLDFSKIEAGKITLENIPFNLLDCIDDTLKMLAFKAHSKNLELLHYVHPEVPEYVVGDPTRLRQVLINLIGNAIKFTDEGEVFVEVQPLPKTLAQKFFCKKSGKNDICIYFKVRDTGIGIPREKQAIIFDKFSQADGSITRRFGGTGLGLAISRALIELMGGHIWVESVVNKGSTFHFTARFQLAPKRTRSSISDALPDLGEMRALVVDDHKTNRQVLMQQLHHWHIKTTPALGVDDALSILRRTVQMGYLYDFIILDSDLPELEGRSLAWHIRQIPAYREVPIIALSALGRGGLIQDKRDNAITAHVSKPYKPADLLEAIIRALRGNEKVTVVDSIERPESGSAAKTRQSRTALRILLAEDNAVNQLYARKLLEKAGHEVLVAGNGREVLEILHNSKAGCDLILMDVQMPGMDGFQTCEAIRQSQTLLPELRTVPIIALTAHAGSPYRERCFAAGMNGFVTKPIQVLDLFEAIEKVMEESQSYEFSET